MINTIWAGLTSVKCLSEEKPIIFGGQGAYINQVSIACIITLDIYALRSYRGCISPLYDAKLILLLVAG